MKSRFQPLLLPLFLLMPFAASIATAQAPGAAIPDSARAAVAAMVAERYAAYKAEARLPDGAGVIVHLQTPAGTVTASAGLPAGANERWHYRIASVSKTFTAASIMLLDQQGKIRIDDSIGSPIPGTDVPYVPESPAFAIPHRDRITIRQLLSHRAGLFDLFNNPVPERAAQPYAGKYYQSYVLQDLREPDHTFTAAELLGVVAANRLSFFEPGADYHYSDTGYTLLARIVERVAGKSYDRFIADNFLGPMGLRDTSAPWNGADTTIPEPFMPGHVSGGEDFFEIYEDNMSGQVGPGNVISTPADIATWARTLLSGRGPLTAAQVARMSLVPAGNATYALGLGNSAIGIGHSGAHPGYVNLVGYHPNDDVATVVATPFIDYSRLAEHLAFMMDVGTRARAILGYPAVWSPRKE